MSNATLLNSTAATRDRKLRLFLLVAITANFGLAGPLAVGIPALARFQFAEGVLALGALSAAGATGGLLGLALASLVPVASETMLFKLPFAALPVLAVLLGALGAVDLLPAALALVAALSAVGAFVDVQSLTWIQKTTDRAYLGRVMSILQFGAFGIAPLSMALAGAVANNTSLLFFAFSAGLLTAALALAHGVRGIGQRLRS